jgi:hypothetical protein
VALLTGLNETYFGEKYNTTISGAIDKAPFIWKLFNKNGFVTSWAEDLSVWGTFSYCGKVGFVDSPVNYYLRPFMTFAEQVIGWQPAKTGQNMACMEYRHESDYVYQYMLDFVTQFKNDAFFGLFWGSSFSHEDWRDLTSMDLQLLHHHKELNRQGILNTSVVIFLSDHGDRYGTLAKTSVCILKTNLDKDNQNFI